MSISHHEIERAGYLLCGFGFGGKVPTSFFIDQVVQMKRNVWESMDTPIGYMKNVVGEELYFEIDQHIKSTYPVEPVEQMSDFQVLEFLETNSLYIKQAAIYGHDEKYAISRGDGWLNPIVGLGNTITEACMDARFNMIKGA